MFVGYYLSGSMLSVPGMLIINVPCVFRMMYSGKNYIVK